MTETAPEPEPDDEIDDWSIAAAQALADRRLQARAVGAKMVGPVVGHMRDRREAYQLLCTLARTVGTVLRPLGHPGGPIGAAGFDQARLSMSALHELVSATQLVGCGASGDATMVRAIALVVTEDRARAHRVALAMLEILAREPRLETPHAVNP